MINGKTASQRYHRTYVYAASTLFKATPVTLQAACGGARLRTGPSTTAPTKTRLVTGTRVTATWAWRAASWSMDCGGSKSGHGWYRITAIDGVSVRNALRVSAVYAARGLLKTATATIPPPPDTSGYIEGIDVSHYQGVIDWARVAASGKRFAFMKASDSTDYVDPTYVTNRAQAKLQGLKVGAYHFARPDATPGDAVAEADHFIATADWGSGDLVPGPRPRDHRRPRRRRPPGVGRGVPRPDLRPDRRPGHDLHVAQLLDQQDGRHAGVRAGRLQVAVDRALDDERVADRARVELGGQRLDVLAVHVGRDRARASSARVDLDRYNRADFGPVLLK